MSDIQSKSRGWRGRRPYVYLGMFQGHLYARFSITCWPDEDHEELATKLHDLISPTFDRVYDGRIGRRKSTDWVPSPLPSQEDLLDLFEEREPGILYYRKDVVVWTTGRRCKKVGELAGSLNPADGHWQIQIKRSRYKRSRIIWKMHYGEDPLNDLDHIDQDKLDDCITNLRNVPAGKNNRNKGHRDGSSYVTACEKYDDYHVVEFGLVLWDDEPAEAIASELNELITPEIDAIYTARVGRWKPQPWLPPTIITVPRRMGL